ADLATLLRPISVKIQEIQNFREKNRGSKMFNHLSAVSESIPALGWIAMNHGNISLRPSNCIKTIVHNSFQNRCVAIAGDNRHVDWVRSYLQLWTELQAYIKEHHTTGLVWSKSLYVNYWNHLSGLPSGASSKGVPRGVQDAPYSLDIAGLRHVLDGQKTHKNPELRSQGGVARQSPTKSHTPSPTSPKAPPQNHFPVLELEGKKWRVEYQDHADSLVISETELKHVVYTFKCSNSTLQIKGKINSIIVDNCKKLGLVFDYVVGIVEVINSRDIQIQVLGKVPTISVNKTEGCHIYLSEESLDCEIVSAKTSEVNILVPQDGDYKEFPVPEQYKTVWDGSKLVTEPTEMAG
ncbi:UNVERIFIED_CONTAM: hypothetical protein FKN15_045835, partial [Acipenser sinensis]